MMPSQPVYEFLRSFIVERLLAGDDEDLDARTPLLELGIIDSMAMVEVIAHIERHFEVLVPHRDVTPDNFQSLDSMVGLVNRLTQTPRASGEPA
jgi:2-hydroxymuconate-semialdehyde hydrolase